MNKLRQFIKRYVPRPALIALSFSLVCAVIYALCLFIPSLADLVNGTASHVYRMIMSFLTLIFPFSVFEVVCLLLLPALVTTVVFVVRRGRETFARAAFSLLGVISVLFSAYALGIGIGYHTTPVAVRCDIEEDTDITAEELYDTLNYLKEKVNSLNAELQLGDGKSELDATLSEMNRSLLDGYSAVGEEYPVIRNFYSRVKPMLFSSVMSDAGLLGMYTFFTGEANVNVEYPDYTVVFTSAHELAHQRGISRENEANFIAFLVCINSPDEYVNYCGYLNMYEYVGSALYRTDKELYREVNGGLCKGAKADIAAASEISLAHKDSLLNKIADALNDGYLKMNGTEGSVSYGYVVRLAVGYILDEN